jgi:hypothetical protein
MVLTKSLRLVLSSYPESILLLSLPKYWDHRSVFKSMAFRGRVGLDSNLRKITGQ